MSTSSSAVTYVTRRIVPSHASWPAGSCSRISRPVAISSSWRRTVALSANVYGASRCGAPTSSSSISGRGRRRAQARHGTRERLGYDGRRGHDRSLCAGRRPMGEWRAGRTSMIRAPAGQNGPTRVGAAARGTMAAMTTTAESPFVRACRRQDGPAHAGLVHAPGRPVAAGVPRASAPASAMLESCRRPDLVCEITLQPVRRHGVDAAILFSDIVVPVAAAGVDLDIVAGTGPVVAEPIRDRARTSARLRRAGRRPTCPTSTRRSGCWSRSWAARR